CTCPLQVTAAQLVTSKAAPSLLVKLLLYPATIQSLELSRLELLIGSYFAVAGAVAGLLKPGRMSLFGVLLLVWSLIREGLFDKLGKQASVYMSPLMVSAVVCAFLSVKYDSEKVQRLIRPTARPLKS
ncbi:hypothetical protein KP509_24G049600, partial [Ceratopteris richardii]